MRLMAEFWNARGGASPTKQDLHQRVYTEMLRGTVRGASGKLTVGMVRDAAKPWKEPIVLPPTVPDARFVEKRHKWKGPT